MLYAMFFCFLIFNDLRWELIVHFIDISGIVLHHCLNDLRWEVIVHFIDIGRIVLHHCLNDLRWEVIVHFIDIGRMVDHHCLKFLFISTLCEILKVILHQFWVKKISSWKFNLEYDGTFTKLFMHVSSWNMFPTTRNLQIRVHVYRPHHCVVETD